MALFEWKTAFILGIPQLDAQHMRLVVLVNELHAAMMERKSKEVLGDVLGQLVDYTKSHFATEEDLLRQYGFTGLDAHKLEHDALTNQVGTFQQKFASGNSFITLEVMQMLKDWLILHIQGTDHLYAKYLIDRGVK